MLCFVERGDRCRAIRTEKMCIMIIFASILMVPVTSCNLSVPTLAFISHARRVEHYRPYRFKYRSQTSMFENMRLQDDDSMAEVENDVADPTLNKPIPVSISERASVLERFLAPKIDDPGLPITDALLAQIVAPSIQIFWIFLVHAPSPSWLKPISTYFGESPELAPRGSLLAPTLIHGAGLAVCWLAGALAARMYEADSFSLKNDMPNSGTPEPSFFIKSSNIIRAYDTVLNRLLQAGAFSTGLLIVCTQVDLLLEFKRFVQPGESEQTDLRLLVAMIEVINDVYFEALVLGSWRILHASFMSNTGNRSKRF